MKVVNEDQCDLKKWVLVVLGQFYVGMAIRAPDGAKKMLVLLVRKLGIYTKELGNYAGYWLRKVN